MPDRSAENLRRIRAFDAEWDESKHSRADNGQFTSGGGGGGKKSAPVKSKAGKAAKPAAPAKSKPAPTPKSTVEANIRRAEEIQESYGWRNGRNKDVDLGDKSGGKYKMGGFYYAKNPYAGRNVQSPGTLVGWTESGDAILYNRRHGRWTATVQNLDDHN